MEEQDSNQSDVSSHFKISLPVFCSVGILICFFVYLTWTGYSVTAVAEKNRVELNLKNERRKLKVRKISFPDLQRASVSKRLKAHQNVRAYCKNTLPYYLDDSGKPVTTPQKNPSVSGGSV